MSLSISNYEFLPWIGNHESHAFQVVLMFESPWPVFNFPSPAFV